MRNLSSKLRKATAWLLAFGMTLSAIQPTFVYANTEPPEPATESTADPSTGGDGNTGSASVDLQANEDNSSILDVKTSNTKDTDQVVRLHLWEFDEGFFEDYEFTKTPIKDVTVQGLNESKEITVDTKDDNQVTITYIKAEDDSDYYLEFTTTAGSSQEFSITFAGAESNEEDISMVVEPELVDADADADHVSDSVKLTIKTETEKKDPINNEQSSNEEANSEQSDIKSEETKSDLMLLADGDTDNWELGLVLYDSAINNGNSPLTSDDWTIEDLQYNQSQSRVITVQINYRNTNAQTTYNPGDLTLIIPDMAYGFNWATTNVVVSTSIGANNDYNSGYEWTQLTNSTTDAVRAPSQYLTFTNANTIEAGSNFEGTIQIAYTMNSQNLSTFNPYIEETIYDFKKDLAAYLFTTNTLVEDNQTTEIEFENGQTYSNSEGDALLLTPDGCEDVRNYITTNKLTYTLNGNNVYDTFYCGNMNNGLIIFGNELTLHSTLDNPGSIKITPVYSVAVTNDVSFHYYRKYETPWTKVPATLEKSASKVTSLDGFENANDYIWVKYDFSVDKGGNGQYNYPNHYASNWTIYDDFPSDCVVYDNNMNLLSPTTGNTYEINGTRTNNQKYSYTLYVGYPTNAYNEDLDTLNITNTAYLWGNYADRYTTDEQDEEYVYMDEDSVNLNLAEFRFVYDGPLYGITKSAYNTNSLYKETLQNDDYSSIGYNICQWNYGVTAIYTQSPMEVQFGDDILYYSNDKSDFSKMDDDQYCFTRITLPSFRNGNNIQFTNGKYNMDLYVRYAGESSYELYDSTTFSNRKTYNLSTDENVVGWYVMIHEVTESINTFITGNTYTVHKNMKDIQDTGTIYNFNYIRVYFKDSSGNLIFQNPQSLDNYDSELAKNTIAPYDLETYGYYIHRATANKDWSSLNVEQIPRHMYVDKENVGAIATDNEQQIFTGSQRISAIAYPEVVDDSLIDEYREFFTEDDCLTGFSMYDLLPLGMELTDTEETLANSLNLCSSSNPTLSSHSAYVITSPSNEKNANENTAFFIEDLSGTRYSEQELYQLFIDHATINIAENWNDTGRTMLSISVDLSETPLIKNYNAEIRFGNVSTNRHYYGLALDYSYKITYDSMLEYGKNYDNYVYGFFPEPVMNLNQSNYTFDGPSTQRIDSQDWNENGIDNEYASYANAAVAINYAVSTHQDVTTFVETDHNNFTTGTAYSSPEADYTYRLRIRTGNTALSNVVLITNLEEAYGNAEHWKGEFLGVDTSYIEGRTYKIYDPSNPSADTDGYVTEYVNVNVYYSTDPKEGDLYEMETVYNDNNGNILTYEDGQYYYMDGNDKVYVEESNVVQNSIRKTDSDGNFIMNSNWKPLTDDVDKSTVKSLAFELINRKTGEGATINGTDLAYVQINMKAPKYEDGIDENGNVLYAYENYRTQWNPVDNLGISVDYVTGIQANTVQVYVAEEHNVTINKVDDQGNPVIGAVLQILDKDGTVLDEWTTDGSPHVITLFNGSYTLHEESCPEGYVIADDITINVKDSDETVSMVDNRDVFDIGVNKYYSEEVGGTTYIGAVEGAVLQVWNADKSEMIDEQTVDETGYVTFAELEAGDYVLVEAEAPDHFVTANDISFTVNKDGTITTENSDNIGTDDDGMFLKMKDEMEDGTITIRKYEDDGKTPLAGVTYNLYDADDQVVDTKTTGEDGTVTFTDIPFGDYTIVETATASGYNLLTDPINVTIPLVLTSDEADEKNADTTQAFYDQDTDSYIFFAMSYDITDDAIFVMPTAGGNNFAVMAFGGMGALIFLADAWMMYRRKKGFIRS